MANQNPDKADFGAKLSELEAITTWFESSEVDLNEALTKFERGMHLADELKRELQQVENRVEKIRAKFDGEVKVVDIIEPDREESAGSSSDSPSLF